MIHYHGSPATPDTVAVRLYTGRHGLVSFACPQQIRLVASIAQSFMLDNGAWTAFVNDETPNWPGYYEWCREWLSHPACDFAVIPDVIDGDEAANDALVAQWPFRRDQGVPVWHLHETISRLCRLAAEWPRVALGSSGEFKNPGTARWWARMNKAMNGLCGDGGRPACKLHGLRMLDPEVFTRLPLASADSSNVARNVGMDSRWRGSYTPASKETRAQVIAERIEQYATPERWGAQAQQEGLFQ